MKKVKKLFNDMDKPLLLLTIFMIGYGLLNIVTASSRQAVSQDVALYHYFFKQSEMLIAALIGSLVIINLNTKSYKLFGPLAYFVVLGLLIYLSMSGEAHRGSINWVKIAGIQFQPSEFAKPVLIVCAATIFDYLYKPLRTKGKNHFNLIGFILFIGCLFPFIVLYQKDLGTGTILLGIFGIMFLASPILKIDKFKVISVLLGLSVFVLLVISLSGKSIFSEEQKERLDYKNPCSNYEDGGYQVCNAIIAINDGGLTGLGIGKSKQKYSYIPEPHTDSVFAIIAEEYGLLFCTVLFIVYALILQRIFTVSSKAHTTRGRLLALGIGVYLFLHIFINLGGLFAVVPLTGVPLPFLSYGGTFTISLICSIAIVQRVCIETKNKKIEVK
jgi:Bacterial cell division membrane protein